MVKKKKALAFISGHIDHFCIRSQHILPAKFGNISRSECVCPLGKSG